jgi:tRNA (adenine22-N1)-methyltransferase
MTALGSRLRMMADNIERGQTMADIGTDHGFLPLYLWESGISPKVIMTDISAGSLKKAKDIFNDRTGCGGIDFRLGDGLEVLSGGEVDVVVIAGMGGVSIVRILSGDILKTLSFGKYIFQPRNGAGKLRFWLLKAGFQIISEGLAEEGGFLCEMIIAAPPADVRGVPVLKEYPDDIRYEIPHCMAGMDRSLFFSFINKKLSVEKGILEEMISGEAGDLKIKRVRNRVEFLEEVLKGTGTHEYQ